jgi:Spy/CpxP family protein refolding chaperone
MKRILVLLFAVMLSVSLMSFARYGSTDSQSGSGQGAGQGTGQAGSEHAHMKMDPQQMVNHLDQELSLTADQKTKITTILENSNKHAEKLMSTSSGDKQAMHEEMRQLHENTHAQIRATLTPDQQTKFDAMMKQQQEEMSAKHQHNKSTSTSTTTTNSTTETPK